MLKPVNEKIFMRALIIMMIFTYSCVEPIDFDTSATKGIGLQAYLAYSELRSELVLKATDITSGEGVMISDVKLISENNSFIPLDFYHPNSKLRVAILDNESLDFESNYKLCISLSGGRIIESDFEQIVQVPTILDLNFDVKEGEEDNFDNLSLSQNFVKYYISTSLINCNGERVGLRWSFYKTFARTDLPRLVESQIVDPSQRCYYWRQLGAESIHMLDRNEVDANVIERFFLIEDLLNLDYAEGVNFYLIQQGLSEGANEYFYQVKINAEIEGGLFDPPFANPISNLVSSNADERVVGYFYASEVDTINRFIHPDEVGRPISECFLFGLDEYTDAPVYCQRCFTDDEGLIAIDFPVPSEFTRPNYEFSQDECQ